MSMRLRMPNNGTQGVLILKKIKILITPATRRWKITTPQINDFFLIILRLSNLCEPAAGLFSLCEGVRCDYNGILAFLVYRRKYFFEGKASDNN